MNPSPVDWALALALMVALLALQGCASGPNEKPRWKAYSLDIRDAGRQP